MRLYKFLILVEIALSLSLQSWGIKMPAWAEGQNLIANTPSGFNPALKQEPPITVSTPEPVDSVVNDYFVFDNVKVNFQNFSDNFGQNNVTIEPTWQWRFNDGTLLGFQTGYNSFNLESNPSVRNIPLQLTVVKQFDDVNVTAIAGLNIFDRLPATANFEITAAVPALAGVTVFAFIEQKPYKFNAATLNNQITTRRFGPNIYWQIDPNTSLFSLYRWGNYNDGNNEQQSFTRIEHRFGQFAIATNLFAWAYTRDTNTTSGYFSPPDFLVYNGEVSWEGNLVDFLKCRLATNLGEQRLNGDFSPAQSYQVRCTAKVSTNIEAELGYIFSNVRNLETGGSAYNSSTISGNLRIKF